MNSKGVNAMVRCILSLVVTLALVAPVSAQTFLTTTTTTNAITATQTTFALGAVTGLAAGAGVYIDRELVTVRSVSGLNVTVVRGQAGTVANSHTASRTAVLIPAAAMPLVITNVDPVGTAGVGGCTPANYRYLPIINATSGNIWSCRWVDNVRVWAATNSTLITYNSLIVQ